MKGRREKTKPIRGTWTLHSFIPISTKKALIKLFCLRWRETCSLKWLYTVNFSVNNISVYNSAIDVCVMWTPLWLIISYTFALGKSINFMWTIKNPFMKFYTHTEYETKNATVFFIPIFSAAKMLKFKFEI